MGCFGIASVTTAVDVSAKMAFAVAVAVAVAVAAVALEYIGWGTADHWMRMQASYEQSNALRYRDGG